jgi:hypothetical protein
MNVKVIVPMIDVAHEYHPTVEMSCKDVLVWMYSSLPQSEVMTRENG